MMKIWEKKGGIALINEQQRSLWKECRHIQKVQHMINETCQPQGVLYQQKENTSKHTVKVMLQ